MVFDPFGLKLGTDFNHLCVKWEMSFYMLCNKIKQLFIYFSLFCRLRTAV